MVKFKWANFALVGICIIVLAVGVSLLFTKVAVSKVRYKQTTVWNQRRIQKYYWREYILLTGSANNWSKEISPTLWGVSPNDYVNVTAVPEARAGASITLSLASDNFHESVTTLDFMTTNPKASIETQNGDSFTPYTATLTLTPWEPKLPGFDIENNVEVTIEVYSNEDYPTTVTNEVTTFEDEYPYQNMGVALIIISPVSSVLGMYILRRIEKSKAVTPVT